MTVQPIALTHQDVLAHQQTVQWPELYQVEQDLLLSLAMTAIFNDAFLSSQVAMRGGTVLHKVHLAAWQTRWGSAVTWTPCSKKALTTPLQRPRQWSLSV